MEDNLLYSLAGSTFSTFIKNDGDDKVTVNYKLNTKSTIYEFVEFTIIKNIQNRKTNDKINETVVDFKFNDYRLHQSQMRSWLLFIRYLQSTFMFCIIENRIYDRTLHLRLSIESNRTCVDDILRAYANVRLEEAKFKDQYLLDEICKIRKLSRSQKV